ncbi:MAG: hypothetical protein ABIH23_28430, partial [bacterium]
GGRRCEPRHAADTRSIYGFSSQLDTVKDLPPEDLAQWLKNRHINAVFVGRESDEVLDALRAAKIRVYREMAVFVGKEAYRNHPDWRPITAEGKEQEPEGWFYGLCPNKEERRKEKLKQFEKLLRNPRLDGVWLDFIRYPIRWEKKEPKLVDNCFCDDCIRLFREAVAGEFKIPENMSRPELARWILDEHLPSWIEFKADRICAWVHEARLLRDRIRPEATIGIFTVPWSPKDFDGAIFRIVGQDYAKLADDVDVFSPMVYHLLCYRDTGWPARFTMETKTRTGKPVWPIIQAMDEPSKLPLQELEQVTLESARASKTGVIIFTAEYLEKEKKWDAVLNAFRTFAKEKEGHDEN